MGRLKDMLEAEESRDLLVEELDKAIDDPVNFRRRHTDDTFIYVLGAVSKYERRYCCECVRETLHDDDACLDPRHTDSVRGTDPHQ